MPWHVDDCRRSDAWFGVPSFAASSHYSPSSSSLPSSEDRRGRGYSPSDGCSYTKAVKSRCFLDKSSDDTPVKKCEKTEQLLRQCVGKPQEVIESKTEYTEEQVPSGWTLGALVEEESGFEPPSFPFNEPLLPHIFKERPFSREGADQGVDLFSRALSGGFESFLEAAEELMNDAFNQLGYRRADEGIPGEPRKPHKKDQPIKKWGKGPPSSRTNERTRNWADLAKDFEEA